MIGLAIVVGFVALNVGAFLTIWIYNGKPATGIYRKDG